MSRKLDQPNRSEETQIPAISERSLIRRFWQSSILAVLAIMAILAID
jgi:hypothetical protein